MEESSPGIIRQLSIWFPNKILKVTCKGRAVTIVFVWLLWESSRGRNKIAEWKENERNQTQKQTNAQKVSLQSQTERTGKVGEKNRERKKERKRGWLVL